MKKEITVPETVKRGTNITTQEKSKKINRTLYAAFVLLSIYLAVIGDYESAFINLGIALVFDPFDPYVKWQARPRYQKIWLIIHLILTLGGFVFYIIQDLHN